MTLRFDPIPYPLWRRDLPEPLRGLTRALSRRWLAADLDLEPPTRLTTVAAYLHRWGLHTDPSAAVYQMHQIDLPLEQVRLDAAPQPYSGKPIRLPAQWEAMEAIILTFPVLYPALWEAHAQMAEAICAVAEVQIVVPSDLWARAAWLYLSERGQIDMARVRWLILPTDDIWVRDYGPFVGLDAAGEQVVISATYDPLPTYPQARDNAMPDHWAAHHEIPAAALDLHLEGGNIWSDGAGTLIAAEQLYAGNPDIGHEEILRRLHGAFQFDKLVIVPSLLAEETGHVDLLTKLVDARTLLVAAPRGINRAKLRAAAEMLRRQTNAAGEPYRLVELPMPPMVLNWGVFPIWRSYTNALTVNGRVLVPVFGVPSDAEALRIYRDALPDHEVVPIDCAKAANGGGAVHCLTKEVPRRG